ASPIVNNPQTRVSCTVPALMRAGKQPRSTIGGTFGWASAVRELSAEGIQHPAGFGDNLLPLLLWDGVGGDGSAQPEVEVPVPPGVPMTSGGRSAEHCSANQDRQVAGSGGAEVAGCARVGTAAAGLKIIQD